jgi:hypothetical protein
MGASTFLLAEMSWPVMRPGLILCFPLPFLLIGAATVAGAAAFRGGSALLDDF